MELKKKKLSLFSNFLRKKTFFLKEPSLRSSASRGVNTESILMSWEICAFISARLKSNEWGSKVVTELSEYLRVQDPTLKETNFKL